MGQNAGRVQHHGQLTDRSQICHIMSDRKTVLSLMTWNWQSGIGLVGGRVRSAYWRDRQARFREQAHQRRTHAPGEVVLGELYQEKHYAWSYGLATPVFLVKIS